ncbi:hypothetical protein SSX86_027326 [Deinandra increscens subsp. villosa]|uniref:Peptidyl-prolyl cis-trans isomerase n=1 Tax=Deinandra increscens subsp. villosa TaxID=3103831 RepID=A0AAP0GNZ4_9ASTR
MVSRFTSHTLSGEIRQQKRLHDLTSPENPDLTSPENSSHIPTNFLVKGSVARKKGKKTTGHRPPPPSAEMINKKNPWVYLDISIGGNPVGRMVIELFSDVVPKTAENFRALCTGEKGIGPVTGKPLHYKGTVFYKIDQRLAAEGGDIENRKGRAGGGECIYGNGRYFEDENSERTHERGTLSMALFDSRNSNGSTFILCFRDEFRDLDGCHVVFGKVIKGMEIVTKIEDVGSPKGPIQEVKIENCGELSEDQKSNVMVPDEGKEKKPGKRAISSDESFDGRVLMSHL